MNNEIRELGLVSKYDDNRITLEIDTRQSKRFPSNNRFLTESISPDVFLNGLKKDQHIRMSKGKIKQLLADAYEADKLIEEEIAPGVMRDIKSTIEKRNS